MSRQHAQTKQDDTNQTKQNSTTQNKNEQHDYTTPEGEIRISYRITHCKRVIQHTDEESEEKIYDFVYTYAIQIRMKQKSED